MAVSDEFLEYVLGQFSAWGEGTARKIFGEDTTVTPDKFCRVEDQTETWNRAVELGREIGLRIRKNET